MFQVECTCGHVFEASDDDVPVWRCPACETIVSGLDEDAAAAEALETESVESAAAAEERALEAALDDPGFFLGCVLSSLTFPFRGKRLYLFIGGSMFAFVPWFAAVYMLPFTGLFLFAPLCVFLAMSAGYYALFLTRVVSTSASGEEEALEWPAVTGSPDFVVALCGSCVVLFSVLLPTWGPILLAYYLGGAFVVNELVRVFGLALLVPPAALLPAATLLAVFRGPFAALHYPAFLRTILVAPRDYVLAVVFILGSFGVLGSIHYLQGVVHGALALLEAPACVYSSMVFGRLVGLYFRAHERRLDWFERRYVRRSESVGSAGYRRVTDTIPE